MRRLLRPFWIAWKWNPKATILICNAPSQRWCGLCHILADNTTNNFLTYALNNTKPTLQLNNFDLLRLVFAVTVSLVHAHTLTNFRELTLLSRILSSDIAVKSFFIISGFLIFMSYEKSSSLNNYYEKRIRRIYPAYFIVVLSCALLLFFLSNKSLAYYFSTQWLKYIITNLVFLNFLQPALPGVFDNNSMNAINGALWTLKIEVMFYITVPIFVFLFRKFSTFSVLMLGYLLSISYLLVVQFYADKTGSSLLLELSRQLPGQLCYFFSGAFFYYYFSEFIKYKFYFLFFSLLTFFLNNQLPLTIVMPFALACIVIFLAFFYCFGNFGKFGDISYGVYILHFPVIQTLLSLNYFTNPYYLTTVLSVTALLSFMMWHLIEKKFLLPRNHYVSPVNIK